MKRYFFIVWMFIIVASSKGQVANVCSFQTPLQGANWCFFENNFVSFVSGSPSASSLPGGVLPNKAKGTATISDKSGNLLFFTDGEKVWNKNFQVMLNGDHLSGDKGATQSSLIIPQPGSDNLFYIFTIDVILPAIAGGTDGINYSRVDLTGDNGLGELTLANKHLADKVAEKITGVRHANGSDVWVLAHEWDSDVFLAYRVKESGLDSIPVTSHAGTVQSGAPGMTNNPVGFMKFSPDGRKLALAISGAGLIELFDFNSATGEVSNATSIAAPEGRVPYGIEFSPEGRYLYFTTVNLSTGADNNLYKIDVNSPADPPLKLNRLFHDVAALQLSMDGKIYVTCFNKKFLGVIENPNRPDSACNYREDLIPLQESAYAGMPNFVQSYFNIPAVTYDTKCFGDQTQFTITNTANTDSQTWDFGDPASGDNTSSLQSPFHQYPAAGEYNVSLTENFNGRSFTTTFPVTIHPLPPKSFIPNSSSDSLYIFPGSVIPLDGGADMMTYMWQNGYSGRIFNVSEPGTYSVFIVDTNCCQMSDTLRIILLDLAVPSAFTPNGDQLNDLLHVKGPTEGIDNYQFSVFNQWGQMMWETTDFQAGWDGKMSGAFCSTGLYTWLMKFTVKGNIMKDGNIIKRGAFLLLR